MVQIDHPHLRNLIEHEKVQFEVTHPISRRMANDAEETLLFGVPMLWMRSPYTPFPLFAKRGAGARLYDVDGHEYVDFFLGISAAMFGHSPTATVQAVTEQIQDGVTFMLPTEDSIWLGRELKRRFGLPYWQTAMTASDAIRFAMRIARATSGRRKVLVFNGCFHGVLTETMVQLRDGVVTPTLASSAPVDASLTTKVIEMNDVAVLRDALAPEDVACVVAEPALTNVGLVLPEPAFHDALREITRETGTYLVIDETHTISTGPGGYTRAFGLEPDFLVLGKSIAGGLPMAVYGCTAEIAEKIHAVVAQEQDIGIVGTLTGNALAIKTTRATMEHVMTDAAYAQMIRLCERLVDGADRVIEAYGLPWQITRLGCRAEYHFRREPPRTGADGQAIVDQELERYIHLFFVNRGILVTPYHNTRLTTPTMAEEDIARHTTVFEECVSELTSAA